MLLKHLRDPGVKPALVATHGLFSFGDAPRLQEKILLVLGRLTGGPNLKRPYIEEERDISPARVRRPRLSRDLKKLRPKSQASRK